jgi:GAF domain-containing protein
MAALRRYRILDTSPEAALDAITGLAARLLDAPIALVTLVDSDRVWFKSRSGTELIQTDRAPGLCSTAILGDGPYVVSDAATDPRTVDNPLVAGDFGLRFYAAAPLCTPDGYKVGVLCVLDMKPRGVSSREMEILEGLARLVMERLEARLEGGQATEAGEGLIARVTELEARHDEKARLSAIAAHDLRNSLGSSLLMARLLLEEKFGALNPRQRQMIESICESGDEMLRLVKVTLEPPESPAS